MEFIGGQGGGPTGPRDEDPGALRSIEAFSMDAYGVNYFVRPHQISDPLFRAIRPHYAKRLIQTLAAFRVDTPPDENQQLNPLGTIIVSTAETVLAEHREHYPEEPDLGSPDEVIAIVVADLWQILQKPDLLMMREETVRFFVLATQNASTYIFDQRAAQPQSPKNVIRLDERRGKPRRRPK